MMLEEAFEQRGSAYLAAPIEEELVTAPWRANDHFVAWGPPIGPPDLPAVVTPFEEWAPPMGPPPEAQQYTQEGFPPEKESKWDQFKEVLEDGAGAVLEGPIVGTASLLWDASGEGDQWLVPNFLEEQLEGTRKGAEGAAKAAAEVVTEVVPDLLSLLPMILLMGVMQMMPKADNRR